MEKGKKRLWTGISILVGTAVGAGVLGIPYVAAQAGFFVAFAYIILLGLIILLVNLYLGEIALRTKGNHQIPGYAKKYLGKKGRFFSQFATIFAIYSAIVAYMIGVGESFSFLVLGNSGYAVLLGILFGLGMSGLLWRGVRTLKKFEKIVVALVLSLLALIFFIFIKDVQIVNLVGFNLSKLFIPFGVILFAFLSFHAVPEVRLVSEGNEKKIKKIILISSVIVMVFYSLFAFVVVGSNGLETPQIATLALGIVFVLLGILTMFTAYLALGNALLGNFMFDNKFKKKTAWFLTSIVPIFIFIFIKVVASEFFSFTKVLAIGGVVSGGMIAVSVLLMVKNAKKKGNRKPEYSIPVNWFIIGLLSLIFIAGIVFEILNSL